MPQLSQVAGSTATEQAWKFITQLQPQFGHQQHAKHYAL
jgi:hypothetical protein